MRTGFIAVWVDHQFVDQLRLDQHVTAAAAFVDNETDGLVHLVDRAFVVKALDHLGKTADEHGVHLNVDQAAPDSSSTGG